MDRRYAVDPGRVLGRAGPQPASKQERDRDRHRARAALLADERWTERGGGRFFFALSRRTKHNNKAALGSSQQADETCVCVGMNCRRRGRVGVIRHSCVARLTEGAGELRLAVPPAVRVCRDAATKPPPSLQLRSPAYSTARSSVDPTPTNKPNNPHMCTHRPTEASKPTRWRPTVWRPRTGSGRGPRSRSPQTPR